MGPGSERSTKRQSIKPDEGGKDCNDLGVEDSSKSECRLVMDLIGGLSLPRGKMRPPEREQT